jgi:hypothetical protein
MTDTKRIHDASRDTRDEALYWLAERVRWERLLTALREEPEVDVAHEREEQAA